MYAFHVLCSCILFISTYYVKIEASFLHFFKGWNDLSQISGCHSQTQASFEYLYTVISNRLESNNHNLKDIIIKSCQSHGFENENDCLNQGSPYELWEAWCKNKVHNWTVDEVVDWLIKRANSPKYENSFRQLEINGNVLPRLFEPEYLKSNSFVFENSEDYSNFMEKLVDIIIFGSFEGYENGSLLTTSSCILFTLLCVCFGIFRTTRNCKLDKSKISFCDLAETRVTLDKLRQSVLLQKDRLLNLSELQYDSGENNQNQEFYDLNGFFKSVKEKLNNGSNNENNNNDDSPSRLESHLIINSSKTLQDFLQLLETIYFIESNKWWKKILQTTNCLINVENLCFELETTSGCLFWFINLSKNRIQINLLVDSIKSKVKKLESKIYAYHQRWNKILKILKSNLNFYHSQSTQVNELSPNSSINKLANKFLTNQSAELIENSVENSDATNIHQNQIYNDDLNNDEMLTKFNSYFLPIRSQSNSNLGKESRLQIDSNNSPTESHVLKEHLSGESDFGFCNSTSKITKIPSLSSTAAPTIPASTKSKLLTESKSLQSVEINPAYDNITKMHPSSFGFSSAISLNSSTITDINVLDSNLDSVENQFRNPLKDFTNASVPKFPSQFGLQMSKLVKK